jgi:subtilisin family serine protease
LARLRLTPSTVYVHALHGAVVTLTPTDSAMLVAQRVSVVSNAVRFFPTAIPFGIDRIDQRLLPLDSVYAPWRTNGGAGVHAYIIDTGIETTHPEFQGRASWGADFTGLGFADCNGHGTHVAGTTGGATVGVATSVSLVAVRVFGCSGGAEDATVVAALDWVVMNAVRPAVVNMSLTGYAPGASPVTAAVENAVAAGLMVVVAAGNSATDACNYTPAKAPSALTVMATFSIRDYIASFSNSGPCADLFAPGYAIESAWLGGSYNALNGTSMASPHVAGAVALYLAQQPSASPASVAAAILSDASVGIIKGDLIAGTPNVFVYVGDPAIPSPRCKGRDCPKNLHSQGKPEQ